MAFGLIVEEYEFLFLLNLLEVLRNRRLHSETTEIHALRTFQCGFLRKIRKVEHSIQPLFQYLLLSVIIFSNLGFKQIINDLPPNLFSLINIIFNLGFVVKREQNPEVFIFGQEFLS